MVETIKMTWHIDEQAVQPQPCPVCGNTRQRVVHSRARPDYVICDACHAAYVMEDGLQKRRLYGQIASKYPQTRSLALKQWRTYQEIINCSEGERGARQPAQSVGIPVSTDIAPLQPITRSTLLLQANDDPQFYFHRLRETGELPNIDDLFEDKKPKSR